MFKQPNINNFEILAMVAGAFQTGILFIVIFSPRLFRAFLLIGLSTDRMTIFNKDLLVIKQNGSCPE